MLPGARLLEPPPRARDADDAGAGREPVATAFDRCGKRSTDPGFVYTITAICAQMPGPARPSSTPAAGAATPAARSMTTPDRNTIVVLGALDTKGPELAYVCEGLRRRGWAPRVLHIGVRAPGPLPPGIAAGEVRDPGLPEGELLGAGKVPAMARIAAAAGPVVARWVDQGEAVGAIAIGGGVGTWIGVEIMRALPLGFPKLVVSTLPFDIRPLLHGRDIVFFPSVADILGLNGALRMVLDHAVAALDGLARTWPPQASIVGGRTIGATGLGVTTQALLAARDAIERAGYELASFHANGIGGEAFEEWIELGMFRGVLDLTVSELTSELFGGVAYAGPTRVTTAGRLGVPQVVCPGGLDFVSRGPVDSLSAAELARPHYAHSPTFTHVRLDAAQERAVAALLAARLNAARGSTTLVVPLRGFSAEGREGGVLHDPAADAAFLAALRPALAPTVRVVEIDTHINDPAFAGAACALLFEAIAAREATQATMET
jgi:uncharacterized protein (UPF0261 family)